MHETTIIMNGSNPEKENKERIRVTVENNFQKNVADVQNKQNSRVKTLRNIALLAGGAGLGGLLTGFMPSIDFDPSDPIPVPDDPQEATGVNDNMGYNDAWQTACGR